MPVEEILALQSLSVFAESGETQKIQMVTLVKKHDKTFSSSVLVLSKT